VLALSAAAPPAFAAGTTLQWIRTPSRRIRLYRALRQHRKPGIYDTSHVVGKATVTQAISDLADGATYYFAVTARDTFGNESGYSNEVVLTTPAFSTERSQHRLRQAGRPAARRCRVHIHRERRGFRCRHSVQYQFRGPTAASRLAPCRCDQRNEDVERARTYTLVRVDARCFAHTSVVSSPSPTRTVTIAAASPETVSAPPHERTDQRVVAVRTPTRRWRRFQRRALGRISLLLV